MRPVSGWAHMMRQTATVAAPGAKNGYGERTYGAVTSYRCRLVGRQKLVLAADGREVLSRQTLYLMTEDYVDTQSQLTLSTGDVGSTESFAIHPPILAVGRYPANNGGFHHTCLFLGGGDIRG